MSKRRRFGKFFILELLRNILLQIINIIIIILIIILIIIIIINVIIIVVVVIMTKELKKVLDYLRFRANERHGTQNYV